MREMLAEKTEDMRKGDHRDEGMDLVGELVRAKYEDKKASAASQQL